VCATETVQVRPDARIARKPARNSGTERGGDPGMGHFERVRSTEALWRLRRAIACRGLLNRFVIFRVPPVRRVWASAS
jgi:hypothetical protein